MKAEHTVAAIFKAQAAELEDEIAGLEDVLMQLIDAGEDDHVIASGETQIIELRVLLANLYTQHKHLTRAPVVQ